MPLLLLSLDNTSLNSSPLIKLLQLMELEPSYKSNESNIFPLLHSLLSIFDISPHKATVPS